jgi:hypothetical protein
VCISEAECQHRSIRHRNKKMESANLGNGGHISRHVFDCGRVFHTQSVRLTLDSCFVYLTKMTIAMSDQRVRKKRVPVKTYKNTCVRSQTSESQANMLVDLQDLANCSCLMKRERKLQPKSGTT